MRLIDADMALELKDKDMNWVYDLTDLDQFLAGIPTADAEPVRHGKWLDEKTGEPVSFDERDGCPARSCRCSECGEWLVGSNEYPVKGNYCPNCGAKMDGKSEV